MLSQIDQVKEKELNRIKDDIRLLLDFNNLEYDILFLLGYYELVQVLLAMNANVEDRGSKGDCTPLMEAASGGFIDIVQLLLQHGANINAQSSSGNTALHYACCSGYDGVVQVLIQHNADLEHQNENGHTPLMEAASGGHVKVASLLLEKGAGINTHSSEFKESALTLACYKGNKYKQLLKGALHKSIPCLKTVQMRNFSGRIFPHLDRMRENTDHRKLRIWTLSTQCIA